MTAHAATVSFDPPSAVANVDDVFSMTITGSGFVSDLDGGGLSLAFDPMLLMVQDVTFDSSWDFFTDSGIIDNTAGTITDMQFNQFGHPKTGTFDIAEVQFQAKAMGVSPLRAVAWKQPFRQRRGCRAGGSVRRLRAGRARAGCSLVVVLPGLALLPLFGRRLSRS